MSAWLCWESRALALSVIVQLSVTAFRFWMVKWLLWYALNRGVLYHWTFIPYRSIYHNKTQALWQQDPFLELALDSKLLFYCSIYVITLTWQSWGWVRRFNIFSHFLIAWRSTRVGQLKFKWGQLTSLTPAGHHPCRYVGLKLVFSAVWAGLSLIREDLHLHNGDTRFKMAWHQVRMNIWTSRMRGSWPG